MKGYFVPLFILFEWKYMRIGLAFWLEATNYRQFNPILYFVVLLKNRNNSISS